MMQQTGSAYRRVPAYNHGHVLVARVPFSPINQLQSY